MDTAKAPVGDVPAPAATSRRAPRVLRVREHTVEIVSDSGEGAQKCGQIFGAVSAKMGNGVWTVEIIPAEIQPPARTPPGGSGNRVRIGVGPVTNGGDEANLVVAFNEQVLLGRHRLHAIADDAVILLDDVWSRHDDAEVRRQWEAGLLELGSKAYRIVPVPLEEESQKLVENPRKGKNMFALGVLCWIYGRDLDRAREQIAHQFRGKKDATAQNVALLDAGHAWADAHLDLRVDVPATPTDAAMVVTNGNEAIGMGAMAAGMSLCAMYPITPATSVSHYLGEAFDRAGGLLHQAEDEIAAAGVAIGASYAGRTAFTITSGPGLALKTEFLGLAVMTETPLVLVDVQRGGPSTGLPTKVEQSDLLAAMFGQPGDAPKVVLAPATIEECFHVMVTARRIAESFRVPVLVLSDANLATGVQPWPRPTPDAAWQAEPPELTAVAEGTKPYDWDGRLGLSRRVAPGTPGGMHTVTGLSHDERSKVAYDAETHARGCTMRSRKLAVLQQTLVPPTVVGPASGDLLVVGWGSTKGAIEEAADRARAEGLSVATLHLRFLSPLEPGLTEVFRRYRRVMTVEINYSDAPDDPFVTEENRRRGQLSMLLRSATLVDVDCWTLVRGEPLRPGQVLAAMRRRAQTGGGA
ncbi:MAG: 2-oxoacid:acceptor oxidoreductase subunit alpha [Planctomycetes bacterium]|nr:2-oxoacid:acceptor oxidoreductase subunit alpha [Planctomycetota bacterium]